MLNVVAGLLTSGAAPDNGQFESIATVTIGAGGASSASFNSIAGTYKHLQIRAMGSLTSGGGECKIEFNGDTTVTNYYNHVLYGSGSTAAAASANNTSFGFQLDSAAVGGGVLDILDYANTNKYKTARNLSGNDTNGGGYITFRSGLWKNTNAITDITIRPASGNFAQYSQFALYGIKG